MRCVHTPSPGAQVFPLEDLVSRIDDHGWTVRAEPVPEDERELSESERMLHVYHFCFEGDDQKQVRPRRAGGRGLGALGLEGLELWGARCLRLTRPGQQAAPCEAPGFRVAWSTPPAHFC